MKENEHSLNWLAETHLESIKNFYEKVSYQETFLNKGYRFWLAHYFNLLITPDSKVLEVGCGEGGLLELLNTKQITGIDLSETAVIKAKRRVPYGSFYNDAGELWKGEQLLYDYIIISDTLNYSADVHLMLSNLKRISHPRTRLLINFHSNLWRPLLALSKQFKLSNATPLSSWFAPNDVSNLLELSGWSEIKREPRMLLPTCLGGIDIIMNKFLAPMLPWLCFSIFSVSKPQQEIGKNKSFFVSVVIPARNESGNIISVVERVPNMGYQTELIFVEGNSTDDTWEVIQRLPSLYPEKKIKILQQPGKGKGDAVRSGFAVAEGDIFMILDADLTMPPEELPKFYHVLVHGVGEFANGVRLVYPMEKEAMQFLNLCANKFFGLLFSWLIGQPVKDTLCGTKVLWSSDYKSIVKNRNYFGDFDPFGDFDLLFGAGKLNLKIVDIPIRYRERTFGTTNISRWKHGMLLLRMAFFAAKKIKFV